MSATNALQPIIIKRKKVSGGGGHHGGAWKVAYADFVTAMMAFFLLMWLLNATTEQQRKGLADFFNPSIPMNRISAGGDGPVGGDSVFTEDTLSKSGTGAVQIYAAQADKAAGDTAMARDTGPEAKSFAALAEKLTARGGESMVSEQLARHIITRVTDEGLIVEFFDTPGEPLFDEASEPTQITRALAGVAARVFGLVGNPVAVQGFTAAAPEVLRRDPSWDVSTGRAQVMRKIVSEAGLDARRFQRVTGFADRQPVANQNPMSPRNNRIELILLRSGQA
ncbi:flagellar motor protein MotB [Frigidibacter sp. MR17.24]|uniref:flagellar motor protein MotB n=1 Tax=Frigidibacter sp. MR17.24 TaxID=3127345 RepID=UPI003013024A